MDYESYTDKGDLARRLKGSGFELRTPIYSKKELRRNEIARFLQCESVKLLDLIGYGPILLHNAADPMLYLMQQIEVRIKEKELKTEAKPGNIALTGKVAVAYYLEQAVIDLSEELFQIEPYIFPLPVYGIKESGEVWKMKPTAFGCDLICWEGLGKDQVLYYSMRNLTAIDPEAKKFSIETSRGGITIYKQRRLIGDQTPATRINPQKGTTIPYLKIRSKTD